MGSSYRGFWSYVRKDDEDEGGRILKLAKDVIAQYEMITGGDTIDLFTDEDRIEWGDKWREKIDDSLESVAFFVPVMTPRYFNSPECRRELQFFARRAEKLPRLKELLLPLYYLEIPSFEDESAEDDLIRMVSKLQRQDWGDLRFNEVTSEAYRRGVFDMACRLVQANKHVEEDNVDEAAPEMEGETGEEGDDTPGTLDRLARWEEALTGLSVTLIQIVKQIKIIGDFMNEGTSEINKMRAGRGEFARRLEVTRGVARKLDDPTDKISMLSNQYVTQLHDVDDGIRIIIERAPVEIEENPEEKNSFCDFFKTVRTLSEASNSGYSGIQSMIVSAAPVEKMSRDIRPVLRRLRQALTIMLEGREVSDGWAGLIEGSGIDCR